MWGCSESINIVYFKTIPNTLKHVTNTQWVAFFIIMVIITDTINIL